MLRSTSLVLAVAFGFVAACRSAPDADSNHPAAVQAPPSPSVVPAGLRLVAPSRVCMVNNRYMGTEQIPTEIAGQTYYGCCPACAGRLRTDSSIRRATDPASGESIDKATALIAATESGSVLYFKSAETLAAYGR